MSKGLAGTWRPNVNDFRINQKRDVSVPLVRASVRPRGRVERHSFDSWGPRPAGFNEKMLVKEGNIALMQDIGTKARIEEDPKAVMKKIETWRWAKGERPKSTWLLSMFPEGRPSTRQ